MPDQSSKCKTQALITLQLLPWLCCNPAAVRKHNSCLAAQAAGGSGTSAPPSVLLMQQNTRLIILTLEVLSESGAQLRLPDAPAPPQQSQQPQQHQPDPGLEENKQSQPLGKVESLRIGSSGSSILDPVGYVAGFPAGGGAPAEAPPAAVRLLIGYMGAMLRSRTSAAAFVGSAAACYRRGAGQKHAVACVSINV